MSESTLKALAICQQHFPQFQWVIEGSSNQIIRGISTKANISIMLFLMDGDRIHSQVSFIPPTVHFSNAEELKAIEHCLCRIRRQWDSVAPFLAAIDESHEFPGVIDACKRYFPNLDWTYKDEERVRTFLGEHKQTGVYAAIISEDENSFKGTYALIRTENFTFRSAKYFFADYERALKEVREYWDAIAQALNVEPNNV